MQFTEKDLKVKMRKLRVVEPFAYDYIMNNSHPERSRDQILRRVAASRHLLRMTSRG